MYNKTRQVETVAFVMSGSLDGAPMLSEAMLLDLGWALARKLKLMMFP